MATLAGGSPNAAALAAAATAVGVRMAEDDTWEDIFSRILLAKVEPYLGNGRATCSIGTRPSWRPWHGPTPATRASRIGSNSTPAAWN